MKSRTIIYITMLFFILAYSNLAAQWQFNDHNMGDENYTAYDVFAIDVDNDNDVDVVTCSFENDQILWCENLGNNNFENHIISSDVNGATSVHAIDMDADGDVDLLSGSSIDDKIDWYENDGNQNFIPHTISTTANGVYSIFAIDVDGDLDIDVLSASYLDDRIAWYENDGEGYFTTHTITANADGANTVFAIDLDGDLDTDVLSASWSDSTIAWYENDGSQNFTMHDITTSAWWARSVFAIDLDGDTDIDVLSTSLYDKTVAWYENDGDENFVIHTLTDSLWDAISVYATDMDRDRDEDIVAVGGSDSRILLFENQGDGAFVEQIISTQSEHATHVFVEDLNGDGNMDIITSQWEGDMIKWYEQVLDTANFTFVSVDNHRAFLNDTILIPLNVDFSQSHAASSAEIEIEGYQGNMDLIEIILDSTLCGDAGWIAESNDSDSLLKIWMAGSQEISGTGTLLWMRFATPQKPNPDIPITIKSLQFNTDNLSVISFSGKVAFFPGLFGDVNINNKIEAYDASLILQQLVGKTNLDTFQIANGNVSLDSSLSALDATYILQYGVGLIDSLPYNPDSDDSTASGTIASSAQDMYLGEMMTLPVYINNGENILSFQGEIHYDSDDLIFSEIIWSENLNGVIIQVNKTNGMIKFSAAGTKSYNEIEDVFCYLKFEVAEELASDSSTISIKKFRWNEDKIIPIAAEFNLINKGLSAMAEESGKLPQNFHLGQNYPNPFNPSTMIKYQLPINNYIELSIYNLMGQKIATLVSEKKPAGVYQFEWNANGVASGVYYYRLESNSGIVQTKKLVLLK